MRNVGNYSAILSWSIHQQAQTCGMLNSSAEGISGTAGKRKKVKHFIKEIIEVQNGII